MSQPGTAAPAPARGRRGRGETLASFMRAHARNGDFAYLHDDAGGGRAAAAACMLLLLRVSSWAAVQEEMTDRPVVKESIGQ